MDDSDYIDTCGDELWQIIEKMHKRVRYEVVHWLLQEMVKDLEVKAVAENWLRTATKSHWMPFEGAYSYNV